MVQHKACEDTTLQEVDTNSDSSAYMVRVSKDAGQLEFRSMKNNALYTPRKVPLPLQKKVKQELERME